MYGYRASNQKRSMMSSTTRVARSTLPLSRAMRIEIASSSVSASGERRNSLIRGGQPGTERRHAAPLCVIGKLRQVLMRRDSAAFTARQGSVGFLDRGQYLETPPLALLPQQHGFLDCVFLAAKSPLSMAWRTKASWSGDRRTSIPLSVGVE
jgi:hypothetical protein